MIPLPDIKKNKYSFGLYIVSTPIGNLRDITLRALDILSQSEYILCEDTRFSKKLLDKYQIKSNLISNHKFNEKKNVNKIIDILNSKKIVSLISMQVPLVFLILVKLSLMNVLIIKLIFIQFQDHLQ